jgi:predicted nucleic-acid-binding protein
LDTNVIARYITWDDPRQSAVATRMAEQLTLDEPGYLTLVTIVEPGWVLGSCYYLSHAQIGDALLRTKELLVERAALVMKAVRAHRQSKAGLADCLIALASIDVGCAHTVTFDRDAAKHVEMKLLV